MKNLKNSLAFPGNLPIEKDELYRKEKSDQYKIIREVNRVGSKAKEELRRLRKLESDSKGLEPAYLDSDDLMRIIEYLLLNKSTVSKAFYQHELKNNLCTDWAKRTIKYPFKKYLLKQAIDLLNHNTSLLLMEQYSVLDIKSILKSDTYPNALNKMKKQLVIAQSLQDKDDQLAMKDQIISDKDNEIDVLTKELLRNKSKDWKKEAIELKKNGLSVSDIAKQLSKGRTTISTYLNKLEVKSLTAENS
jgi:hypothetical protein